MEPILHLLIPVLLVMVFFPKIDRWLVLKLSFLTFLMDFDLFIPGYHRVIFHNIFFLILVSLLVYFIAGKLACKIAAFFLGTHLVFDLIYWGNGIFWPILNKLVSLNIEIYRDLGRFVLDAQFKLYSLGLMEEAHKSTYLSPIGSLVLIVAAIILVVYLVKRHRKLISFFC